MKKAALLSIIVVAVQLVGGVLAHAQQVKKVPRIGYLSNTDPARESTRLEGIRLALRERGYIEGKNIAIEDRYADGKDGRFPELAAELVLLKVDIIVVSGNRGTLAAKNTTKTIPIVMVARGPILSRRASLKALPVPAATAPALQIFPEN